MKSADGCARVHEHAYKGKDVPRLRHGLTCMFFFKQKTTYEISACLVGSEMCIRDSTHTHTHTHLFETDGACTHTHTHLSLIHI